MRKGLIAFMILMVCSAYTGMADDTLVTASLDKRAIFLNEELRFTIQITGVQGNIQAPRLPGIQGFNTFYTGRSSQITVVNNRSTSSVEFNYVLVPQKPGRFLIGSFEIQVGEEVFETEPMEVEVKEDPRRVTSSSSPASSGRYSGTGGYGPAPAQSPQPQYGAEDGDVFVEAVVDKTTVYPNEQVLLTYHLYTRYDTRYEGFQEEPEFSGFWIEEFPEARGTRQETAYVNGRRYVKAELKKVALFPTAVADYTIQPGSMKVSIRQEPQTTSIFDEFFNDSFFSGGGFFARRENRLLTPSPIYLKVVPLPQTGKPESFEGAVGNYRLSASIDHNAVKQDEPVTMTLVIEGEGNIETLQKPQLPSLEEFKVYDADTASQLFQSGNVISGRKTFEIVFIPIQSGQLIIPSLEFSFFNPAVRKYQILPTPEFVLNVSPSDKKFKMPTALSQDEMFKKDIRLEGQDIRYIWERVPGRNQMDLLPYLNRGMMTANILVTLLVIAGLIREQREKLFARDNSLKRRKYAKPWAESKIRRLQPYGRSKDPKKTEKYFEEIGKILTEYLSDKFNLSAYGVTVEELEIHLAESLGRKDALYQEIMELYRICEESRFAKAKVSGALKTKALKILRDTIRRVERIKT